jgi:hypothetical protein
LTPGYVTGGLHTNDIYLWLINLEAIHQNWDFNKPDWEKSPVRDVTLLQEVTSAMTARSGDYRLAGQGICSECFDSI